MAAVPKGTIQFEEYFKCRRRKKIYTRSKRLEETYWPAGGQSGSLFAILSGEKKWREFSAQLCCQRLKLKHKSK